MNRYFTLVFASVCLLALTAQAGRIKKETRHVKSEGAKELDVEIEFGAGELRIYSDDIHDAAVIDLEYDPRHIEYEIDYEIEDHTGLLHIATEHGRKSHIGSLDNQMDVALSSEYTTSLELQFGACEAIIDLGGIPLERLEIEAGAASGQIDFSAPNPERLKRLNIEAGASSLEMYSLGNANFDMMEFSGGVGAFELDFRGEYSGESEINIEIGLGSAEIILPRNLPVHIETNGSGFLSSIDFHNDDLDEIDDGVFESEDFRSAKDRIVMNLEVGMGSIDTYFKR